MAVERQTRVYANGVTHIPLKHVKRRRRRSDEKRMAEADEYMA